VNCNRRHKSGHFGFTLIEVLVALAVVATAATIFISLFGSSLVLSRLNRSRLVAASLAEEQLEDLLRNSSEYVWNLSGAEAGELVEVTPAKTGNEAPADSQSVLGRAFGPLEVVPVEPGASEREENFYGKFRWRAYAALPQPDAKHVNVTVVVRWRDSGGEKSLALTSSAPRYALETSPLAASRGEAYQAGGQA